MTLGQLVAQNGEQCLNLAIFGQHSIGTG